MRRGLRFLILHFHLLVIVFSNTVLDFNGALVLYSGAHATVHVQQLRLPLENSEDSPLRMWEIVRLSSALMVSIIPQGFLLSSSRISSARHTKTAAVSTRRRMVTRHYDA